MRVEEVKTSFIADTQKYIKDIQKAQKVLNTFLNTNDMTKKEKAENRLQVAIQKRAQAQAKALMEELKYKRQVDATNSKLASSQNNVNKSISKSSSSSKMFAGELAHLARNVMTLYYSVKSLGRVLTTGIDFNKTKENAKLAFTVMFRSADVASQKIRELQEYAVASPLSFKETISASKQLSAYGFGADTLVQNMEMLGTVAKATGHSLDDISYVYGTLRTQGRAYSRDLMQFSMRGIPIYEELAEVLKVDQKEIKKLTEEGKVGFKEVEKAFKNMTKEGGKFGGLLDEYMKGFEGMASQLGDTLEVSLGQMTESIFGVLKTIMADAMNALDTSAIQKVFSDLGITLAVDLREIMSVLVPLLKTLLKLTPAIITFFKAWLMYTVLSKAFLAMKAIPKMLRLIKIEAAHAAVSLRAMSASSWVAGLKASLTMALGAIKTFANTVKLIIASNPMLAAIAGILAIGSAITITILHKNAEKIERERSKIKERAGVGSELLKYDIGTSGDFLEAGNLVEGIDYVEDYVMQSVRFTYEGIDRIAKAYGVSMSEAARIVDDFFTAKKMPDIITDNLRAQISDMETRTRAMKNFNVAMAENIRLQQQEYLNQKLGRKAGSGDFAYTAGGVQEIITAYFGSGNTKTQNIYNTAGGKAGAEYVQGILGGIASKEANLRRTYAHLYDPSMMQDNIKSAIEEVESTLAESAKIPLLFENTTWDEQLRTLLEKLRLQLEKEGDGKEKKAIEIKLDPWFDREKMAAATEMIFDDLELQRDKDFANAQDKLKAQEISFEQYSRAINAISEKYRVDRMQAEKDEMDSVFDHWKNGSEEFFSDLQRGLVKAMQTGKGVGQAVMGLFGGNLVQGSEIGNVVSSASQYKKDFLQKKRDEWIASGRNAGDFNEEFALAEGKYMGTYNQGANVMGSVMTQAITAFVEMALSVENVQKVLDPFGTMMEAAGKFLKPLLSVGFSGIASVLTEIGGVLGQILLPILMPLMMNLQFLAGLLKITIIPVLQIVGGAFAWLYDTVMVPFGNAVIDLINGVIDMINRIPWMDIEKLERFKTTVEMLAESSGELDATMQYMIGKLNRMIDEELQSLQDLYEVGAISGAELQSRTDELNLRRMSLEENMVDINVAQMESLDDIYNWLRDNGAFPDIEALIVAAQKGIDLNTTSATDAITGTGSSTATPTQWENAKNLANEWGNVVPILGHAAGAVLGGAADIGEAIWGGIAGWLGFADGTSNIPYDMVANVHKGEGIIPATFMDSIRAGELMLSAGNTGGGGSVSNYYITVEGSVTSENDLADSLAEKIEQRRTRGYGRR